MRFFRLNAFWLLFWLLTISACTATTSNSNQTVNKPSNADSNVNSTKDDIEDFAKIVKLPVQPVEVSWREPVDKKIIAILKYSAAETQNLITQIEKQKPAVNAQINAENWFPPELIAQSQQSGDETLKGFEYTAADFFLAPYTKGKITRIAETNYFVLELSAQ